MNRLHFILLAISVVSFLTTVIAQTPGPRDVPARTIPVPATVSPQMQKMIAAPLSPTWNVIPKTAEEWKAQVDAGAAAAMELLPGMRKELGVIVLAIRKAAGEMVFKPPAEARISSGDHLIVMGRPEGLRKLEQLLAGVAA